jgi:hypothetical protein
MPGPVKPHDETQLKLHELSEETLINTAIAREIHLRRATRLFTDERITPEEYSEALDEVMTISGHLTEEQQTAVYVFAQAVCESRPAPPSEEV